MEWNQIEGQWDIIKGEAKQKWAKFTDDDLMKIKGQKDVLVGHIKQYYGVAKEEAEKQIEEFRLALKKGLLKSVPKDDPTTTSRIKKN